MTRTLIQAVSAGALMAAVFVGPIAVSAIAFKDTPSILDDKVLCYARGISCGEGPVLLPAVLGMR
ncbi:hypothetical protein [Amorphus sp. 3PC139-8]|uniref:hypothetical protein n=1 Tax=Amorphus sp. 3PC139-8 TaxID=2735676 RepID=UPI00345DB1A6